jgi:PAS domain S-box-containing protein
MIGGINLRNVVNKKNIQKMILSLLIPCIACAIQWVFWDQFQPFIWFLFYPAVFFSAQIGGRRGGIAATLLSAFLVDFFFVDPIFSLQIDKLNIFYSAAVFIFMGVLLSNFQEKFRREQQKLQESESTQRKLNTEIKERSETALNIFVERLDLATHSAQMGIWDWDIQKNQLIWDDRMYQLYGVNREEFSTAYEAWLNGVHPDDRDLSNEVSQQALRGERKYDTEFRVLWPDGSIHWLKANGQVFRDTQGMPLRMVGINYDITERKWAEDALHQSRENFAHAFENNPSALAITSRETGKFILINKAYTAIMGYTPEELIGSDVASLSIYANPAERNDILQIISKQGRVINYDLTVRGKGGQIRNILVSMESAIYDNEDCILSTFIDITDRKQMEGHLRESEKRFATLFRSNPVAVGITHGADNRIVDVNDAWSKLTGYKRDEMLGRTSTELGLAKPEAISRVRSMLKEQGGIHDREIQLYTRSGQELQILMSSEPLELAGETYFFNTLLDITERKQAEEHLRESEEKYRTLSGELEARVRERTAEIRDLYDNAPVGYHSLNADGIFIMVNQTEANWLGYLPEELIGRPLRDFVSEHSLATFQENFPVFKKSGQLKDLEMDFIRKDGSILPTLVSATIVNNDGGYLMSRSVVFDNSERKKAQDALKKSEVQLRKSRDELSFVNAALEKALRSKDEFLTSMSHELRTPLTGILGLTESLQLSTYGELNEKQSNALKNVEASGRHLLELINDILDLSKIESSKFDIYPEILNIEEICRASLLFVTEQANKKSITLEYQEVKGIKSVFADPRRLKQILVNLLSNAVKFTPEKGKVTLAVRTDPERGQNHFSVTDTGIGIAKEDLNRLFTPFTQVDSRLNRQYEGTGLGLVLVLRLAEMHGGSVQVETEPGKGSCFTVSLPSQSQVRAPVGEKQSYTEFPEKSAPNINDVLLLVEDNASNVEVIRDYLQFKGYTLVVASNGFEALLKAEESNPSLILMDIQMPIMDGLEAMRRLRADPRFITTPIIALTALAMTGDRERCIEAGANDYLSKPVNLKELTEKIRKLLQ